MEKEFNTDHTVHEMTLADWLDTDDQMCMDIVNKKYLLDEEILGHKETVSEMISRVSGMNIEARRLIRERKFIPAGRILSNRGLQKYGYNVTYSNCYVDPPVEDSIESIYETCKRIARTFSYGGGIGIDISKLAPYKATVHNSAKQSTGAVSFVNTFSAVAETIGQNNRRGALMISINDRHPDLEKFITHKSDLNITQGANMSIRVSDEFFDAVRENKDWTLRYTRKETGQIIEKTVKAKDLMRLIAKTNWDFAEPGMLFWDRITNYNLMSKDETFSYAGVNPCAEEPLPAGGSCLLGAMNLSNYYTNGYFSFSTFGQDVQIAVRYLNEVLDEGRDLHPLKEQRRTVYNLRQIGLGFMGLADLFIKMKIVYGSQDSIDIIHKIGYTMAYNAIVASAHLAMEKGSFEKCNPALIIESDFFKENVDRNPYIDATDRIVLKNYVEKYGLRNSQLLTCAPTGTTSTIFGVSGGIEPVFALEFTRTTKTVHTEDKTYWVNPKAVKDWLIENGEDSIKNCKAKLPDYLITARAIPWKDRINVQAVWQMHIDASISATINLPESTTVEEIEDIYTYAHDVGCKGVTVYRENCKRSPILVDTSKTKEKNKVSSPELQTPAVLTRKELGAELNGKTYYKRIACGHIYITVNRYMGKPMEVFMQSSKSGGCAANTEALGRMASTMLRSGIEPNVVVDSIMGVKCAACSSLKGKGEAIDGASCSDVMARVIKQEYQNYLDGKYNSEIEDKKELPLDNDHTENTQNDKYDWTQRTIQENIDMGICPECGEKLQTSEGCLKCINCGFSKC